MFTPRTLLGSARAGALARQHYFSSARSRERSGLRTLTGLGIATSACYLLFFLLMQTHVLWQSPTLIADRWRQFFYPLQTFLPPQWVRIPRWGNDGYFAVGLYIALLGALFAVYLLALRLAVRPGAFRVADGGRVLRRIFACLGAVLLILMFVPGVLSTDLFSYVWYGRIAVFYGANPLTHVPADFVWHDPGGWLQWVYWKETPSVYGPVWLAFAWVIATVSQALGGDIVNHVLGHKLLASVAHIANAALVWHISGALLSRREQKEAMPHETISREDVHMGLRVAATLAFAWNPLLLIEFGANGHNDSLMVTGVLAAILLHLKGKWKFAALALTLAALVKFIALVFVPGYVWLLYWEGTKCMSFRQRLARPVQALVIVAAAMVAAYLPVWQGANTLKPLIGGPPAELFVNSLGWLVRSKLNEGIANLASLLGWQPADFWSSDAVGKRLDWPARWGAYMFVAAVAAVQTWKARSIEKAILAWGWTLFAYLTVGAVWFWPWYVAWLLGIACITQSTRLFRATIVLSASSLLLYATYWRSSPFVSELETWKPLIMFGPPLLYVLGSSLLARRAQKGIHEVAPRPAYRERDQMPAAVRVPVAPVSAQHIALHPQHDEQPASTEGFGDNHAQPAGWTMDAAT